MEQYVHRTIEPVIRKTSDTFKVVLVTGPRQVGKSTLLNHLAGADRQYISLDDTIIRTEAMTDPASFLDRYEPPLIIDEIQYAPQLLPYIKLFVDQRLEKGQIWLTGSQKLHLMKNVSESLAGRVGIANLLGFSLAEELAEQSNPFSFWADEMSHAVQTRTPQTISVLFDRIHRGSMPELSDTQVDWARFWDSYIQTYIQRDVRALSVVQDEAAFMMFLRSVAARTSQVVNFADIASDCSIAPNTVKSWLSILETSGIVQLVQPWSINLTSRIRKAPKLHVMDTGLCAYLLGWPNGETIEKSTMCGAFFESWVFAELYKSFSYAGLSPQFYYYRDNKKNEIDLLIPEGLTLHPIEIKMTASPKSDDIKAFRVLDKVLDKGGIGYHVGVGALICMVREPVTLQPNAFTVPAWSI